MPDSLKVSVDVGLPPEAVYRAWLSSEGHVAMTGAPADIEPRVGGRHSAWDGYIWGEIRELEEGRRIVQTWRTSDFPADAPDSLVDISFDDIAGGTHVTIEHDNIPEGQGVNYRTGWRQFYFDPMLARFGSPSDLQAEEDGAEEPGSPKPASQKPAAKKPAAKKPAAKKPAAKKPAAKKPAAKKPAAKKPAAKKPAAKKPAAKKPAAKKPAAKKPAAKKGRSKRSP